MFTTEQRDQVRDRVLDFAKSDLRVTAGALTGSAAVGAHDEWSDIDVAFGIADGNNLEDVLDDWTEFFDREWGVVHHWDMSAGPTQFRVFLLPNGLEVDVGLVPQEEFGARGPTFRSLFGTSHQFGPAPQPDPQYLIGLAWHHVIHARASIERGKPWRAEYWISALRDHTLALACLRLGENAVYARGIDRLPATVTDPLKDALARSLDEQELRRALAAATECFITELEAWDTTLCARLKPLLQEFGAPQSLTERSHT
jgi:predicted nucleotidyltransferase